MSTGLIPEANGIDVNDANAFSNALSAVPAGSTHFLLRDGIYNIWASAPFVLFVTDAAHDPPALPATQGADQSYPGAPIPAQAIFQFEMVSGNTVTVNGVSGITPTGIRVFTIGGAGTFYIVELWRRTS